MITIPESGAPISLERLAKRVRRSSNFRFNWQWFSLDEAPNPSISEAHRVLEDLVGKPVCHAFLRESFDDMYDAAFKIEPLHDHCQLVDVTVDFERILAQAASDRLGAYSRKSGDAPSSEVEAVRRLFEPVSPYSVFAMQASGAANCPVCEDRESQLFTNWFYGVAWDLCFCLLSHRAALAWVGCLTDTD